MIFWRELGGRTDNTVVGGYSTVPDRYQKPLPVVLMESIFISRRGPEFRHVDPAVQ